MEKILGLLIIGVALLSGCAGLGDYAVKVNDRYEIWQIYPTLHVIHDNENEGIQLDNSGTNGKSDSIVKINWNKKFLIAKTESEEEARAWFKKHENQTYWILDLETNRLSPPITSETAFKNLLAEKNIPLELMSYDKRVKNEERIY
ncbi:hypothetical protein MFLO_02698 [Listeria floridensis FSL S10-1187]|uniref:Lipoprotein n=1 Tax=Listeria floridensis FSL S10-1187 TaxID=1265817 RepID=A0ABP3B0M0_9LIST|nr:hypothetical protein [Listeria floridensis]EUJ33424.1 hypothetical protein MFLO_02698 [Listeria floridensis FSL S10-1187]